MTVGGRTRKEDWNLNVNFFLYKELLRLFPRSMSQSNTGDIFIRGQKAKAEI